MNNDPAKTPKPRPKRDIARELKNAQLHIVEQALIGFVEDIDGKIPTDETILSEGFHVKFAQTPLSVFEKDRWKFDSYYVWRGLHVVALGFINPEDLLKLYIVRVPEAEWPTALRLTIEQRRAKRE